MDGVGYIKLHRKTLDNPVVCKDSDYLAVWIYLLLNATHKEMPTIFKGQKIILQPGQLITGRKVIADKFNISESKVQRILKTLKIEQQIEQQTSNKNSLISILNWDEYQKTNNKINNERTTSEHKQECKEIYLFLFNKYKAKIENQKFGERVKILSQLKSEIDYQVLSQEEQDDLFNRLLNS